MQSASDEDAETRHSEEDILAQGHPGREGGGRRAARAMCSDMGISKKRQPDLEVTPLPE